MAMDEAVGVVTFRQQAPREVGSHSEHGAGHTLETNETPVRMTFEKVESIDVVIRQLVEVRVMMVEKIVGIESGCTCNERECCPECDPEEN
ncbi:hypothetical protein ACFYU8_25165 [Brevibacillus sp. NPDC003359]|uniref:hypothetical protein n=1 Tax=unclassified Brevibacillus TaxID=2684853 RepID=UPI0036946E8D